MAGLRENLKGFIPDAVFRPLREPFHTRKVVEEVRRELGDIEQQVPKRYSRMETYEEVMRLLPTAGGLRNLPSRHLKRVPWIMFEPMVEGNGELAKQLHFLAHYFEVLKERASQPAIVSLATVFLYYYPEEKLYFDIIRREIVTLLNLAAGPKVRRLRENNQQYGFFWQAGPQELGGMLLASREPSGLLETAGLTGNLGERGFALSAVRQMLAQLRERLGQDTELEKHLPVVLDFLGGVDGAPRPKLRYPVLRVEIADALLLPFCMNSPNIETRSQIEKFLLTYYEDPRIRRGHWQGVDDAALQVVQHWLVDSTLEDFFRVVTQGTVADRDADRMWPYREAFWRAYLRKGAVSEAWVVLGDEITRRSRSFLEGREDSYGTLQRGNGVKPTHAVLILRIGGLLISEWSHSGKFRVWQEDNRDAPRLYRSMYRKGGLIKNPQFEGVHYGASNGSWQGKLATYIRERTGITLNYKEYMPNA